MELVIVQVAPLAERLEVVFSIVARGVVQVGDGENDSDGPPGVRLEGG
jgi:hypothetical protein